MPLQAVWSQSLSDQVFEQLGREILSGQSEPGANIPAERTLGTTFGVNRHVVREALKRLESWSAPIVVAEPSIQYAVLGGIVVKAPGTFAIAYYGSEAGEQGPFDGYMAETQNGLDAAPAFQSVRVNDPSTPLMPEQFDVGYGRLYSGGDLHEIVKPAYAPNGDIWASFARDMCLGLGAGATQCDWDVAAHADSNYQASIGRVVHR